MSDNPTGPHAQIDWAMPQESFGGHSDSKPRGPAGVGIDITFEDGRWVNDWWLVQLMAALDKCFLAYIGCRDISYQFFQIKVTNEI